MEEYVETLLIKLCDSENISKENFQAEKAEVEFSGDGNKPFRQR
jgi:hypothetical protein